jgi:spermidine synthase
VGEERLLLFSVFFLSLCGIIYELVLGSLATYLLGNPVMQYSLTIGVFLSSMGLGSYLSRFLTGNLLSLFVRIEIALGAVGGLAVVILNILYTPQVWFHMLLIFFLIVIGTLVGLEVPLLTRILRRSGNLKEILSNVLTLDYMGGLAGSLLFPLLLFPFLGRFMTSIIIGMTNILVAWVIVIQIDYSKKTIVDRVLPLVLVAGLGILAFQSETVTAWFEDRIYQEDVIFSRTTPFQKVVLTRNGDEFRLYLDGALQFSTFDEYRYHEMLVHPALTNSYHGRGDILVLGGGDGLVMREVLKHPVRSATLVELDPVMIDLAKNNSTLKTLNRGSLNNERVRVIAGDAWKYLSEQGERFDVIIADFPDPHDETIAKLYSREFYRLCKRRLREGGIFVTQSTSPLFAREAFWSIHRTLEEVFAEVRPYHVYVPTFGDWGFNLAFYRPSSLEPGRCPGLCRYYSPEQFRSSTLFPPDTSEVDVKVNTLNLPVVFRYYIQGWKNVIEE